MRSDDLPDSPPTVPQLMKLAQRLEQAWQETMAGAPEPDLTAYLPAAADPLRPLVLRELVRIDLEMRCRRGLPASLESYAKRFPELGTAATLPAELVYCEYRARHRYGDQPSLVVYRDRFPAQFLRLQEMVQSDSRPSVPAEGEPHSDTSQVGAQGSVVAPTVPPAAPSAPPSRPSSPLSARKTGDVLVPPSSDSASEHGKPGVVPMAGGYRLIKRLGAGALGEVWRAEAPGGIDVAVKRLSRSLDTHESQYELQSLEHVKRLRHPYLAQIHAFWVHKGRLHVAMELADCSLLDRAAECRKQGLTGLPRDELLRYMREAAEALDFLHAEGIHHRDIKPANILLLKGYVKVADFGLARPLESDKSLVNATFCGTPAFMAPEVWENKFSPHSDQWSLAVTYAELRLGRRVFQNRALQLLMAEIRGGKFDLSPLGKAEQRVLRRALHLDPRQRYPSCSAFVKALDDVFRPPPPKAPAPHRRRVTAALALAGLVLGGLIASIAGRLMAPPPPATVSLEAPPELRVRTGGEGTAELHVVRDRYPDAVQLVAEGVPPGVEVWAEPSQGDTVRVHALAGRQTRPGPYTIRLHSADGPHAEAEWPLVVLYLPPGFEPVGEETETDSHGVEHYKRIRRPLNEREGVEFILVSCGRTHEQSPAGSKDLETYYISRDKITRGQFAAFVGGKPKELFAEPDPKHVGKKPVEPFENRWRAYADEDARVPVRDVTVLEAHAFAVWLGGRLPSVKQWDKAAGLYHPERGKPPYLEGPYRGRWEDNPRPRVAVGGLEKPFRAGESADDVSPYGCRDMAGNGLEWTRDVRGGRQVPLRPEWGELLGEPVQLRGCTVEDDRPLRFDRMERDQCGSWPYQKTTPDIGFRVVLEPNG